MGKRGVASLKRAEYERLILLIREARADSGLSQDEVGKKANLSQPVLSAIEGGTRRLDVIEFLDLANAMGIDPCAILKKVAADRD